MKRLSIINAVILAVAVVLCSGAGAEEVEEGFVSIFDGKTLKGWEGKEGFWSVKDGAITGQTTEENPLESNTFLIWRGGKPADFELRLKIRIVGGNSGIQYRSKEIKPFVLAGYQADYDAGGNFIGILYDEKGRGILAKRGTRVIIWNDGNKQVMGKPTPDAKILASIKKEGWNDYTIIAKGNRLVQMINGLQTVDVTDSQEGDTRKDGLVALQLHAGPAMTVQIKDVRLKKIEED